MEKIRFASQVLSLTVIIPVIFIGTIMGNEARIKERRAQECNYPSYTTDGFIVINGKNINTRFIMSCGKRFDYAKK